MSDLEAAIEQIESWADSLREPGRSNLSLVLDVARQSVPGESGPSSLGIFGAIPSESADHLGLAPVTAEEVAEAIEDALYNGLETSWRAFDEDDEGETYLDEQPLNLVVGTIEKALANFAITRKPTETEESNAR